MITALHHVQLAMPPNREDEARAFYVGVLGFTEVPKPRTWPPAAFGNRIELLQRLNGLRAGDSDSPARDSSG